MNQANGFLQRYVVPPLTALSENTYMSAIRAGMVSIVSMTIIGSLFIIISSMPISGWDKVIAPESKLSKLLGVPVSKLLEIPVTATFGLLSIFVCFSIAYDLGKRLKQEGIVSGTMATVVFLMMEINLENQTLSMGNLGSRGVFTAILIALITVRVQKFFNDKNVVIKLPKNVPPVVYESFLSLTPLFFLLLAFWIIRFVLGVDVNHLVQTAFQPAVHALNTLPGILVYAFLVTMLWSVGINGDNAMDAIVAPIFLQYLTANVEAATHHQPIPYVTAQGFFTTYVNVGGTGVTIALALVLWNSKEPGFRKVSRMAMPTQIFQINEPMFFGIPIVLNPIFMIPYVLSALTLTATTYLVMSWGLIQKPYVNVPWTTPPIIGHFLVSGGDWRAAVWGCISIVMAMAVYYPFAKVAERQRLQAEAAGEAHE